MDVVMNELTTEERVRFNIIMALARSYEEFKKPELSYSENWKYVTQVSGVELCQSDVWLMYRLCK